jgi:hypothetical protein
MIEVVKARQLMEITKAGWTMLTDEEFLQIIGIYNQACIRAEATAKQMKEVEGK